MKSSCAHNFSPDALHMYPSLVARLDDEDFFESWMFLSLSLITENRSVARSAKLPRSSPICQAVLCTLGENGQYLLLSAVTTFSMTEPK